MRKICFLVFSAFLLGFVSSITSCKDSELVDNGGNGGDQKEEVDSTVLSQKYEALLSLLSATAGLDTLPANWNESDYTVEPTIGTAINSATPHIRYVSTSSVEEADRKFRSMISSTVSGTANSNEWKMEGVGELKFNVVDQPDLYATLDVKVKQLPHLEQICFVPVSVLGENGLSLGGKPYYQFGDVVSIMEPGRSDSTYWVCVRPASESQKLRKTHWCSFQMVPMTNAENQANKKANFITFSKNGNTITLPTKLGSNKSKTEEQVQNFFNVLRILAKPSSFEGVEKLDDIKSDEFSLADAKKISQIWIAKDLWNKITNGTEIGDLRDYLTTDDKTALGVSAFYLGYSSGGFLGLGDKYVYRIDLKPNKTNLFDKAEKKTPKVPLTGTKDFSTVATTGKIDFSLNSSDLNPNQEHTFIVRHKTGHELEGLLNGVDKDGIDDDATIAFKDKRIKQTSCYRKTLTIKPLSTPYGFYTFGDIITTDKECKNKEFCVKETGRGLLALPEFAKFEKQALFLKQSNSTTKPCGVKIPDVIAKFIMCHLCAALINTDNLVHDPLIISDKLFAKFENKQILANTFNSLASFYPNAKEKFNYQVENKKVSLIAGFYTDDTQIQNGSVTSYLNYKVEYDLDNKSWSFTKLEENDSYDNFIEVNAISDENLYYNSTETTSETYQCVGQRPLLKTVHLWWIYERDSRIWRNWN